MTSTTLNSVARPDSPERRIMVLAAFPESDPAPVAGAMRGRTTAEILALLAVAPAPREAVEWAARRWPPPLDESVERWNAYAADVERRIMSPPRDHRHKTIPCARCGSHRVTIMTKQLRRADEGATELRHCRECGHTARTNS